MSNYHNNQIPISSSTTLSAYDALVSGSFSLLWQWNQSSQGFPSFTHPTIDDKKGIIYVGILPYLYALNTQGNVLWKAQVTTFDEMTKDNLQTFCVALNTETNMTYIVISSLPHYLTQAKSASVLFIVPVRSTTGEVLSRMNIEVPSDSTLFVQCPILVGNELLYLPWYLGSRTQTLPLNVAALPQVNHYRI